MTLTQLTDKMDPKYIIPLEPSEYEINAHVNFFLAIFEDKGIWEES